jgi:hypothetical protein
VTTNMDKAIGRHLRHAAFGHAHEALAWAPLATGFAFLETPRWREGQLWAADMFAERLVAIATDGTVQAIDVPGVPTGIGWNPQGKLLVLTRDGRLLRNSGDTFDQIGPALHDGPAPCNELTVTAGGIGFVGVFGLATGALLAVTPDGSPRMVADDLLLPNGQQLTPTGTPCSSPKALARGSPPSPSRTTARCTTGESGRPSANPPRRAACATCSVRSRYGPTG